MSFQGNSPSQGELGSTAKSVHARDRRFALQRVAAGLLPTERVGNCLWTKIGLAPSIDVRKETGSKAHFTGLQTCGSVWHCPVCSQRISEARRKEANKLLAWARAEVCFPVLLTLTARHGLRDALEPLLDGLKGSLRALRRSRAWGRLKPVLVGSVTATEVTHGRNGWHPHFHVLVILKGDFQTIVDGLEGLRPEWLRSLAKHGLEGNGHAFAWQAGNAAGQYVAKFGAAEELTLGAKKEGRLGGRSPVQLLEDAGNGDAKAGALFREYARAFKGRRQLSWSPGLKALVGVDELDDDELAKCSEAGEVLARIAPGDWARVRRHRARVLAIADLEGQKGLLTFLHRLLSGPD